MVVDFPRKIRTMKKLLTMLASAVIAFSLAVPVFAQDTGTQEAPKAEKKTKEAKTHAAKTKKTKAAKEKTDTSAPKQ